MRSTQQDETPLFPFRFVHVFISLLYLFCLEATLTVHKKSSSPFLCYIYSIFAFAVGIFRSLTLYWQSRGIYTLGWILLRRIGIIRIFVVITHFKTSSSALLWPMRQYNLLLSSGFSTSLFSREVLLFKRCDRNDEYACLRISHYSITIPDNSSFHFFAQIRA